MANNRKIFIPDEDAKLGTEVKFDNVTCITKQAYGFLKTVVNADGSLLTFSNVMYHEKCSSTMLIASLISIRDSINIVLEQSKPTIKIK